MPFILAHALCFGCGQLFSFNPMKVPSIMHNGTREPICLDCVNRANPARIANGLEPIAPLAGAYEPCDESELAE